MDLIKNEEGRVRCFLVPAKSYFCRFLFVQLFIPLFVFLKRNNLIFSPTPFFPIGCFKRNLITIHDCAYDRFREETGWFRRVALKTFYVAAKYFAGLIVTVSEFSKNELIHFYNFDSKKVRVVYNIVPDYDLVGEEVRINLDSLIKYFVCIGMNRPRKNLKGLLVAFKKISLDFPDYKLLVLGHLNKRFYDFKKIILELGLEKKVVLVGFVKEKEKEFYLKNSEALVVPSFYEGFGIPIVEAQKLGVTVLASNQSAIPEVAGRGAYFFDPYSVDSIYEVLKTFIEKGDYDNRVEKGKDNIGRFDKHKLVDQYFSLFGEFFNK